MTTDNPIVLLLGTNIGDREGNLNNALALLESNQVSIIKKSFIYETEPMDLQSQPYFLNQAVEIATTQNPTGLLKICQSIENEIGRIRTIPKGPRIIDLDILIWGNLIISEDNITIPHPSMHQRPFALIPLLDICPQWTHPLFHKDTGQLLSECRISCKVTRLKNF